MIYYISSFYHLILHLSFLYYTIMSSQFYQPSLLSQCLATCQDPVPPGYPRDLSTVTVSTRQDPYHQDVHMSTVPPGRPHVYRTTRTSTCLPYHQDVHMDVYMSTVPPGCPHVYRTTRTSTCLPYHQDVHMFIVPPGRPHNRSIVTACVVTASGPRTTRTSK